MPTTPTLRTSRTNSSASLQSVSSSTNLSAATGGSSSGSGVSVCLHRSHHQLEELRTLKLEHNRLQSVAVCLIERGTAASSTGAGTGTVVIYEATVSLTREELPLILRTVFCCLSGGSADTVSINSTVSSSSEASNIDDMNKSPAKVTSILLLRFHRHTSVSSVVLNS